MIVFHVMDDDELDFPFNGPTRFEGLELPEHLACNPRALREGYLEALNAYLDEVRRGCSQDGVDYVAAAHQPAAGRRAGRVLEQRLGTRRKSAGKCIVDGWTNGRSKSNDRTISRLIDAQFCPRIVALVGAAAGRLADLDPPDQPDAAPPRPVGGHGVLAGQPEAAPEVDPVQAIAAAAVADGWPWPRWC